MFQTTVKKFRWASRKLNLPVWPSDLVLEVGSGGNPHPYADVLLEKFIDNGHRLIGLKLDRFSVIADACQMPFKDGAFDYSISYHVLEHVKTPDRFLDEMARVSRAGYIETPNVFYERCQPFDVHLTELALYNGKLYIRKKAQETSDPFLASLNMLTDNAYWKRFFESCPEAFHVCLKWQNSIDYEILDADTSLDWFTDPPAGFIDYVDDEASSSADGARCRGGRGAVLNTAFYIKKKFARKNIDYDALLACPITHKPLQRSVTGDEFICEEGGYAYPIQNGIPVLLPDDARQLTAE